MDAESPYVFFFLPEMQNKNTLACNSNLVNKLAVMVNSAAPF
jgi:hypothetical protein